MVEAGAFGEDEPIYLWRGRLAEKMTKGNRHAFGVSSLDLLLTFLVPEGCHLRQEQPVQLGTDGMPEPDLAIVRGTHRDYIRPRRRGMSS